MPGALIKLLYRQIIDASSPGSFEKNIIEHSYNEFQMKSQVYNPEGKLTTFTELKTNDGRANSLHYKSGFAIGGFINQLNNQIPGLKDASGQFLTFESYKFEVIESDINNRLNHQVAINYITGLFTLYEIIGESLLIAPGDKKTGEAAETFLLKIQPGLSVCSYQQLYR